MPPEFRSGYVALVGKPNVGKSTLLNALLGRKLSIVTPKPQTTRHSIAGIVNEPHAQIVFVDTPGLQRREHRALNRLMHRSTIGALEGADLAVLVLEGLRWDDEDEQALGLVQRAGRPLLAAVNKVDRVRPREQLLPHLARLSGLAQFAELVPVSATRGTNLSALRRCIVAQLPPGPRLFPLEAVTDRDALFQAAEVIREKLMLRLHDELPYGIAVGIERYETREDAGAGLLIVAQIWVERAGQKAIVIGRGGATLKEVGRAARLELVETTGRPVHLELWVKVRERWADDERALRELGYESPYDDA